MMYDKAKDELVAVLSDMKADPKKPCGEFVDRIAGAIALDENRRKDLRKKADERLKKRGEARKARTVAATTGKRKGGAK